jgi:hypothetical protein
MAERLRTIRQAIYISSLAQGKPSETGQALEAVAISFAYALEDIPTHHLEEAFRRAIQTKVDDFPLTAAAVNRAYQEMIPDLQRQAQDHAAGTGLPPLLVSGLAAGMNLQTWKERHNLPQDWRLGDPYPPECDLYDSIRLAPVYACLTCKDAGWVADWRPMQASKLIPCPACR